MSCQLSAVISEQGHLDNLDFQLEGQAPNFHLKGQARNFSLEGQVAHFQLEGQAPN